MRCANKNLYVYVQKKHNLKGSKVETNQIYNEQRDKHAVYPYNGGFFGHKKT